MAKTQSHKEASQSVVLDTDVIVNWLAQETETGTGKLLWEAPFEILKLIENRQLNGISGLTNILELRFLLRRKKNIKDQLVAEAINFLEGLIDIIVPDEITLLRANLLQSENLLDPFDSIILAIALAVQPTVFISRDKSLLEIASRFLPALTPEDYIAYSRSE